MSTVERAFAARVAADARSADSAEDIGGGVLLRTPSLPDIWDLNVAMLGPGASDADVAAACELEVRRVTIFRDYSGSVPPSFDVERSLLMVREGPPPPVPPEVVEVDGPLMHEEDEHAAQMAEMHRRQAAAGARTFAIGKVASAVVADGCVDDVFVVESERGRGLGRTITTAAVAHGGWFLWTEAADPRPQGLYRSLGFAEAGRVVQLTRRG